MSYKEELAQLRLKVWELEGKVADEKYDNEQCSFCGIARKDAEYGYLWTFRLIVNPGDEGAADITILACDDHAENAYGPLHEIGFANHDHGSTSSMDDWSCPGHMDMEQCPYPDWDEEQSYVVPFKGPESVTETTEAASPPAHLGWHSEVPEEIRNAFNNPKEEVQFCGSEPGHPPHKFPMPAGMDEQGKWVIMPKIGVCNGYPPSKG